MPAPFAVVSSAIWDSRKIRRAGHWGASVFLFALTKNAAHGNSGAFPSKELDVEWIADRQNCSIEEARMGLTKALESGLLTIDDDIARIVGWDIEWARRTLTESAHRAARRRGDADRLEPDGDWITYAIRAGGSGFVKIGRTTNIKARMESLRIASPHDLEVVGIIYGDVEADLHERFAAQRVRGEWFTESAELLRAFVGGA